VWDEETGALSMVMYFPRLAQDKLRTAAEPVDTMGDVAALGVHKNWSNTDAFALLQTLSEPLATPVAAPDLRSDVLVRPSACRKGRRFIDLDHAEDADKEVTGILLRILRHCQLHVMKPIESHNPTLPYRIHSGTGSKDERQVTSHSRIHARSPRQLRFLLRAALPVGIGP
jgi:hypothetical protein